MAGWRWHHKRYQEGGRFLQIQRRQQLRRQCPWVPSDPAPTAIEEAVQVGSFRSANRQRNHCRCGIQQSLSSLLPRSVSWEGNADGYEKKQAMSIRERTDVLRRRVVGSRVPAFLA
uniref:Uncharacterized protein n=1 Tax=Arundo donax TaxID=35708 RepID=A0A0A9AZZ5_ARUDO